MSHQRGSGVFNSLMPSHSWPVVVLPETWSKSLCSVMMISFLPQRHSRRLVEGFLVARPKRVSHDCDEDSDEDRRPEGRDESRCDILNGQDCTHRSASAKIGFFVVKLEIDQRAEHLQVSDQRVQLGGSTRLAVEIAGDGF